MDSVSRRRRNQRSEEPAASDYDNDFDYQAALSHANPVSYFPTGALNVEANSRPPTLDADAGKLRAEYDDAALGNMGAGGLAMEPDYGALGQCSPASVGPRVARVETVDSRIGENPAASETLMKSGAAPAAEPKVETAGLGESDLLGSADEPATSFRDPEPSRITPEDTRELIPERGDRVSKLESLLERALEENKELKKRLQTESASSWHSARTPGELPASPASFAMRHHYACAGPPSFEVGSGVTEEQHSLVRQVMIGLSPSASVWWQGVEGPANLAYQKWLGEFDKHLYSRVESRSVSLLLAAVPQSIRSRPPPSFSECSAFFNLEAECEAAAITAEGQADKRARKALPLLKLRRRPGSRCAFCFDGCVWGLESQPTMSGRVDLSRVDASWLLSVTGVSDCSYALVDSGATNALRPAEGAELSAGRVIRVDLASGTAELRINDYGTLLHAGSGYGAYYLFLVSVRERTGIIQNAWGKWKAELASAEEVEERPKGVVDRIGDLPFPRCTQLPLTSQGYKYFLACSYAVPEGYKPLETGSKEGVEPIPGEVDPEGDEDGELFPELLVVKVVGDEIEGTALKCSGNALEDCRSRGDRCCSDKDCDLVQTEWELELPDGEERIIVKPPALLVELGVLQADDRWHVRKALYGLPTSPRDWGDYRDKEFRTFVIRCNGVEYGLFQTKSDESLWLVQPVGEAGKGAISGLLVVYVDDLAFFSTPELCQCFVDQVQRKWKTSDPNWLGSEPTTFCGAEIVRTERGYCLSQVPLTKWSEPEPEGSPDPALVKEAQGITGAILWVATRSRPDVSYAVSRMGQQATKAPQLSISIGHQVLQYLHSTLRYSIEYCFDSGPYFSGHGLLAVPRRDQVLEVYSDASHSPCGGRSVQAFVVMWRGSPLAWESTRQSFVTLSSAEAELVAMSHAIQMTECIQPLIDELLVCDTTASLLADNSAAIRSFDGSPSGWRSRHLRMRALSGREKIAANQLTVHHIPGDYQLADIATKPLSRGRILQLLDLMNVRDQSLQDGSVKAARLMSRFDFRDIPAGLITPESVAGLALLALLPRAKGQPVEDQLDVGFGWLAWTVGVLLTVVLMLWGWWLLEGLEAIADSADFVGLRGEDLDGRASETDASHQTAEVAARDYSSGSGFMSEGSAIAPPPDGDMHDDVASEVASSESSEFNEEQWRVAQQKLEEQERFTGLTWILLICCSGTVLCRIGMLGLAIVTLIPTLLLSSQLSLKRFS
ncbi:RE1 [Symbiodinium sp. CCMP2592]|nr:RE1 [Symbiodinium sp. CCMP2592]